jgi:hypothetical protein
MMNSDDQSRGEWAIVGGAWHLKGQAKRGDALSDEEANLTTAISRCTSLKPGRKVRA